MDIGRLKSIEPSANNHDYDSGKQEESHDEEEPEEPLGIMTEVAAIVFLVAVHGLLAFFD